MSGQNPEGGLVMTETAWMIVIGWTFGVMIAMIVRDVIRAVKE